VLSINAVNENAFTAPLGLIVNPENHVTPGNVSAITVGLESKKVARVSELRWNLFPLNSNHNGVKNKKSPPPPKGKKGKSI
jgi:hypothetical protein